MTNDSGSMSISSQNDDLRSEDDGNSTNRFTFEDNVHTFKEKAYLHHSFKVNISKPFYYIIIAIILVLIISISIAISRIRRTDYDDDCEKSVNLLRSLVISTERELWNFDLDSKKYTIVQTSKNEITAFDTYMDKTVILKENNTSSIRWLWNKHSNLTHTKRWKPQALAVDYITENLYLIDKESETLNVIDMKNNYYGVVISHLQNIHDQALDPVEGFMFIVQHSLAIVRASLDGTSAERIIEGTKISAITIDCKATRIYWANDMFSIESSDYKGNERTTVTAIPMSVSSLAIFENQLFWTQSSDWSKVYPCTDVLWSCTIYRRVCKKVIHQKLPFENPKIVRTSYNQHRHFAKNNPCEKQNGGCQQLCLTTSYKSHSCACNTGWTLNPNNKTCDNVTDLMLYVQGNFIRGKVLSLNQDKEAFTDAIIPTKFFIEKLQKKPYIHFDYNMISGDFFFSDDHNMYKLNVLHDDDQSKIFNVSENHKIRELAFDWIKECIYYVKESQHNSYNHTIEMFSVTEQHPTHKIVLTSRYQNEHYIECPFFLVVQPTHEYLFYTEYNGANDNLQRINANGRGMILLYPLYGSFFNLLAIDTERSRLYWTATSDFNLIKSINIDASEDESVRQDFLDNPGTIGVYSDWLYIGNDREIWRIHKQSGDKGQKIVDMKYTNESHYTIHGLKVFSLAARNANY